MKREVYESQKAFAGEKKPSMLRRYVGHDYTERMMYMVTMVVEGRRPLLGAVVGRSDAPADSDNAPRLELTELGQRVYDELLATPEHHPEISVVALQMMPDHLHVILFVKEMMASSLGMALRGFKQKCNQHYRELVLGVKSVVMKRGRPDLFRVQRNIIVAGQQFSAIGNRFLLQRPVRLQVQCSRSLTDEQIAEKQAWWLSQARSGAVLVSPCRSAPARPGSREGCDARCFRGGASAHHPSGEWFYRPGQAWRSAYGCLRPRSTVAFGSLGAP